MRNVLWFALALVASVSCRKGGDETGDTAVVDADSDGVAADDDCDDTDATVRPGAAEICDGIDQDCDGTPDDGATDTKTFHPDADGDGHGVDSVSISACEAPDGFVASGDDCDDADADVHPGADEADCADPVDYNCDGSVGYEDGDGDGSPACDDCADDDPEVHPGQNEICNGIDDDCEGTTDATGAAGATTWYTDADGDGFGDPATASEGCSPPPNAIDVAGDCDDADDTVNPDAAEVCDHVDQDCDGSVDEGAADMPTWHPDGDSDGHGATGSAVVACDAPSGFVDSSDDCDDGDSATHPGATEDCDTNVDRNCDASVGYADADGDGTPACKDCDDGDATERPGAAEVCDGDDDDCDGSADESGAIGEGVFYADTDGDGAGNPTATTKACTAPSGYVANASDCDDTSAAARPGTTYYADADGDGTGGAVTTLACAAPAGFVASTGDCNDADKSVYPGATEACDGRDGDCNGAVPANEADADADGTRVCGGDCDDTKRAVAPNATEVCDGLDDDCNGAVPANETDADNDGQRVCAGDCNDAKATTYLGATEQCNGVDDDCSSGVPVTEIDDDGDGQSECKGDCNDASKLAYLGATEIFYDGIDGDCKGGDDWDADGDGLASAKYGKGSDYDDTKSSVGAAGSNAASAVDDCAELKALIPTSATGLYYIDPTHDGSPYQAYCEMTLGGGGWTLISNRRANSTNTETCGANLAAFFDGCGAATAITATDSYAMARAERGKLAATQLLNVQYLNGVADLDDAYQATYAQPGTDLFPNTNALQHFPLVKACDVNGSNCDSVDVWWKYIGDYWYHSSMCLSSSSFDSTYRGNYGLCVNGVASSGAASTYPSSNGFGNRDEYNETKLWAHPNNAAQYQERLFYR